MGLGIKKKVKYLYANVEELLFVVNSPVCSYSCKLDQKSGHWFITNEDLVKNFRKDDSVCFSDLNHVMKHEFNVLGTGFCGWGSPIVWSQDVITGYKWPKSYYKKLLHGSLTGINGCDVKVPWEISRFQHITILAKAYLLTNEEKYAGEAVEQIEQWIVQNPWCYGVNWTCAMEVSIRVCNWIWALQIFKNCSVWTDDFHLRFTKSIWQHGYFIMNNLEDKGGIRTNHYLSDVVGLFFIGTMFPEFKQAEQWKRFGLQEIISCMDEMVYKDGVGFENSTGYHRLVTELFLFSALLARKNRIVLPLEFMQRLELMFEYIQYCMRPDGKMPMVGDADDGRLFIFSDHFSWDKWDFRYLLAMGAKLFNRKDFVMPEDYNESTKWVDL